MRRFLSVVLLFAAPYALGQSNFAVVRGTVYDPQRNPVSGSEVQLTSAATHAVRRAISNEQGIFEVNALWPGEYELAVQSSGFVSLTQTLRLEVNQQLALDLDLKLPTTSNALNHTNLGTADRFVNTPQFGTISEAATPGREIQLSARVSF